MSLLVATPLGLGAGCTRLASPSYPKMVRGDSGDLRGNVHRMVVRSTARTAGALSLWQDACVECLPLSGLRPMSIQETQAVEYRQRLSPRHQRRQYPRQNLCQKYLEL